MSSHTCKITLKRANFDFQIQKSYLFDESNFFKDIILKNPEQTEFILPQDIPYDKNILNLFFSDLKIISEGEEIQKIKSETDLLKLFELSQIFQTPHLNEVIFNIMKEKKLIYYFFIECNKQKGQKITYQFEKQIFEQLHKLDKDNISQLTNILNSREISIERKIRIFSKIKPDQEIYLLIRNFLFDIFLNENLKKEEKQDKQIFMILYNEEEIQKETLKRTNLRIDNIFYPKLNEKFSNEKKLEEKIETIITKKLKEQNIDFLKKVYPVGALFTSYDSKSPATLFGFGLWEPIIDRFLYCSNNSGTIGGQISHSHEYKLLHYSDHVELLTWNYDISDWESGTNDGFYENFDFQTGGDSGPTSDKILTANTSNSSNMPPYITVYCWRRIE